MVKAALAGRLNEVRYAQDPVFGVSIPQSCPEVPAEVLTPRNTWTDSSAYNAKAKKLAGLFVNNFKTFDTVAPRIIAVRPVWHRHLAGEP